MKKNIKKQWSRHDFIIALIWMLMVLTSYCNHSTVIWAAYKVRFEGVEDHNLLTLIQTASQLYKLKENAPNTLLGLKRRAQNDLEIITQVLHSKSYYNATVDFAIADDQSQVTISIHPGYLYPFAIFSIRYLQNGEEIDEQFFQDIICLNKLKIAIGDPALPESILYAEDTLLDLLNLEGYAFASIKQRDVFADQQNHNVIVLLVVETGPTTYFGKTQLQGLKRVHDNFIHKKLRWCEGELYNPHKIEKTQEALELSGIFRSVNITHSEKLNDDNELPIKISVVEAKQHSIGLGLNYTTALGPGITAEWEDRNLHGAGEKLSIRGDVWRKLQEGSITYLIPDFGRYEQNLIWKLEKNHARTKSFSEYTLSLSGVIERKINEHLRVSIGGAYKLLRSQRSINNGTFDLLKAPIQVYWSNTDSILDPTKGVAIHVKSVPSLQILAPIFAYSINSITAAYYYSLTHDNRHIFATKLMVGSIIGASQHNIPPPELFYAGSASTLRGYHYFTVCPLGRHDKPLGGRSLFIYSLELRNRIGKNFGYVIFYELGNVYRNAFPDFKKGFLQSVGLGLSYYTPIGPIRLDIAMPLNRRHSRIHPNHYIDSPLEAYFSIGQSF